VGISAGLINFAKAMEVDSVKLLASDGRQLGNMDQGAILIKIFGVLIA